MTHAVSLSQGRHSEPAPIVDMNTTPLVDVMLVLLIMFIVTVPSQSHQVEVALPRPGPVLTVNPIKNELSLSAAGQLSWNGKAITDAQLAGALADVAAAAGPPEVHFRPEAAARYERVDQVLAIAARSGTTTFGFSGNEQYREVF